MLFARKEVHRTLWKGICIAVQEIKILFVIVYMRRAEDQLVICMPHRSSEFTDPFASPFLSLEILFQFLNKLIPDSKSFLYLIYSCIHLGPEDL